MTHANKMESTSYRPAACHIGKPMKRSSAMRALKGAFCRRGKNAYCSAGIASSMIIFTCASFTVPCNMSLRNCNVAFSAQGDGQRTTCQGERVIMLRLLHFHQSLFHAERQSCWCRVDTIVGTILMIV